MSENLKKAIDNCRGLHCSDCPIRELSCEVLIAEFEDEMTENYWELQKKKGSGSDKP